MGMGGRGMGGLGWGSSDTDTDPDIDTDGDEGMDKDCSLAQIRPRISAAMGKWKKAKRRPTGDPKEPIWSRLSILIALLVVFLWVGFRGVDIVVISLGSTLLALTGFGFALLGGKIERRRRGSTGSSGLTQIAYWIHFAVLVGSFLLFSYSLAIGILRGDFI
jgi:hypothetical protein